MAVNAAKTPQVEGYSFNMGSPRSYESDDKLVLSSRAVERAIKPIPMTRKAELFTGSDDGARHWAIAMTLIQTAKLNGVEPLAWLTDVPKRIVSRRTKAHELQTLLPWNWAPGPEHNAVAALAA